MRRRLRGFLNEASKSRLYGQSRDLASVHIAECGIRFASCPVPPRGFYPCNARSHAELVPTMGTRLSSWPGVTWADGRSHAPPVNCHQRGPRSDRRQPAGPYEGSADDLEGPRHPGSPCICGVSSLSPAASRGEMERDRGTVPQVSPVPVGQTPSLVRPRARIV